MNLRVNCILFTVFVIFIIYAVIAVWFLQVNDSDVTTQAESYNINNIFVKDRIIYELPNKNPVGVFFIAHACTHSAKDFWLLSPQCNDCVGLAEEVLIVKKALQVGFIVVAISSFDTQSGCWDYQAHNVEFVSSSLINIRQTYNVTHFPIFALGTSSGGSFVWHMASNNYFDAIIIQVMAIDVSKFISSSNKIGRNVPVIFNPMRRDIATYNRVVSNVNALKQQYGNTSFIYLQECVPLAVSVSYLESRLPWMDRNTLISIRNTLIKYKYIDKDSSYLIRDPTAVANNWRDNLIADIPAIEMKNVVLERGKSPLAKALNRAWAFHEYCSDYISEDLIDFLRYIEK
jgi:hypothetical protein